MRLTISVPCFGRPQRTRRMIDAICSQTIDGWEALIIGDGCQNIQGIIDDKEYEEEQKRQEQRGNRLIIENSPTNNGGFGFAIINQNIQRASGEYFIFASNDDIILPNHFENYLGAIEGTDFDFVYLNSYVEPYKGIRISRLVHGSIGHSELIVKSEFARKIPPHSSKYGHDWIFIDNMIKMKGKHTKANDREPTYIVKSVPVIREDGID